MLVIFNHLITSFFTAKNLSKGEGFFKFFQIFNIRFFYAFIFIRKKFNKKTFIIEGSDTNIFFKDNKETSLSILSDLNTKGYHDKLQLDEFNLKRIYNEISLKNSSISFKGQKRIDEKTLSLNNSNNLDDIVKVFSKKDLKKIQDLVTEIKIEDNLLSYIAKITHSTRNHGKLYLGASPRASLAMAKAAKAMAGIRGRDFITPDDIQSVANHVLNHRIILTPEAEMEGMTSQSVIQEIIHSIEVPR